MGTILNCGITTKKIMPKNKIHFEISERKMILRLFDVIFFFGSLYLVGNDLNYLEVAVTNGYWALFFGGLPQCFGLF
jgi:hypothetical protein